MPAKEYTVGIPIATVIFLTLIVLAFVHLNSIKPNETELRDESVLVIRELRQRSQDFIPPNNDDLTGPTLFAESDEFFTTIRVYGLISPERQNALIDNLRTIRTDLETRPILVHFHYPKQTRADNDSPSVTPNADERPEPFRTVRVDIAPNAR